ncbi:MAG: FAD-binding protein [Candidatus Diapherotrites archaeon]
MNSLERKPLLLNPSYSDSFDVCIFGSGLAGLSAAFYAADSNNSVALIYSSIKESSSIKAKGGIAVPIGKGDSVKKHIKDTLTAGKGLCNYLVVDSIIKKSIPQIKELIDLGLNFDEVNGRIHLGKEGGHSEERVLHIMGDETGKGLTNFMVSLVKEKGIHLFPNTSLIDFEMNSVNSLNSGNSINALGAIVYSKKNHFELIKAKSFVIATGGHSSLYSNSTNSPEAIGNASSAAFRAGIALSDLEFVQFHPTTIPEKKSNFVVTESVRGEKALLVNSKGTRFMKFYSPLMELATRDIISKAIYDEEFHGYKVFLDATKLGKKHIKERFPSFAEELKKLKINPDKKLIPITPSAHYCIGGIKTGINAETNALNVFAAGEASASGLHGANRLACNSLLEAIVMGRIAGENAAKQALKEKTGKIKYRNEKTKNKINNSKIKNFKSDYSNELTALRKKMWERASIIKSKKHLLNARDFISRKEKEFEFAESINAVNYFSALQLSNLIVSSALKRKESRGVHQRIDYPAARKKWLIHQEI